MDISIVAMIGERVQDRLTELETQLAFKEDVMQQLNAIVTSQQQKLELLQHDLRVLQEQFNAMREKLISTVTEPPPPHY